MVLKASPLVLLVACASAPPQKQAQRLPVRRAAAVAKEADAAPARRGPSPAISALPPAPESSESPRIIDSSLRIELDNGRGGKRVRVGTAFALHGQFQADDVLRFAVTDRSGRVMGSAVECPQRATSRSGAQVRCRGRGETLGASLLPKAGSYRFTISLARGGKTHRLRRGAFEVFPCSFGLCVDKDFRVHEHWGEFVGEGLNFRVTIKRRPALPALHANPKKQAKAKPATSLETMTTRCRHGKTPAGEGSESFELLDDDGVWTAYRVRSGLGAAELAKLGAGTLRCRVTINGKHHLDLSMELDPAGRPKIAKKATHVVSPWFWLKAKRPRQLDRNAGTKSAARAKVFWGRPSLD